MTRANFPKWNKVWIFHDGNTWSFTPHKESIPNGADACEYTQNNDPFRAKVKVEIIEEPLG